MDPANIVAWLQRYGIVPVLLVFVLLVLTTYWPGRKASLEKQARIPFDDDGKERHRANED